MYNEYVHKIRTIVGTVLIYIALYSTWINLHVHMYHLYVWECYRSVIVGGPVDMNLPPPGDFMPLCFLDERYWGALRNKSLRYSRITTAFYGHFTPFPTRKMVYFQIWAATFSIMHKIM